jgi:hypothetical protein
MPKSAPNVAICDGNIRPDIDQAHHHEINQKIGVFSIVAVGVNTPPWVASSVDGGALRPC